MQVPSLLARTPRPIVSVRKKHQHRTMQQSLLTCGAASGAGQLHSQVLRTSSAASGCPCSLKCASFWQQLLLTSGQTPLRQCSNLLEAAAAGGLPSATAEVCAHFLVSASSR